MGSCGSKEGVNLSPNESIKDKKVKRIVCIGGGHCNCQVLKLLRKLIKDRQDMEITLVTDNSQSYYSGMLPGSVSTLYKDEQIMVHLEPLAVWSHAKYIQQKVVKIEANKNRIHLKNGSTVEYDVLCVNVGSRTKAGFSVPGVWENSLTTRPINELLPKIRVKEENLKEKGIIPRVVVVGGGAAGTELSLAFKARWGKLFEKEIDVTLLCSKEGPLPYEPPATRTMITKILKERNVTIESNCRVKEILPNKVVLTDGREFDCDVPIWATGAEPQEVSAKSDLALMNGYFRVNNNLQSTSHPNVFSGGDCITMENFADKGYPTKAGVYAVREGPIIAENIVNYLEEKSLIEYIPQRGFLALMMTGDGMALGSKFGISFYGKWVWEMKNFIDLSFMTLFDPNNLFRNYDTKGFKYPIDNF
eukprot:CAMPEP_0170486892 /NCGR_PEP_ID=MMETSP0208-20121228/5812_1 /TAXON_ID=197538 /ORGANISM="Strombidium inclinatum, Strain S3" /LENGTH=417 /DNA_ID=CAMNT_0010760979 /DNA_START=1 /DNA_END=1254 /DNA_ORIENTATION=+